MTLYRAFGLNIASDLALPELAPAPEGAAPDVEIAAAHALPPLPPRPAGTRRLRFHLRVPGIADFRVEDGKRILYRRAGGPEETVRLYLLGSCLGCALLQRGLVVLHGNAVTADGGGTCRIIVGHSGAGKSTAAALAYRDGAGILTDDVCAIAFDAEGRPLVQPGYPQIKLWRAAADLLGIPTAGLRRIHPGEEKFALPVADRFWPGPVPLAEVVELSPAHTEPAPLGGFDKARCLMEHTYRREFLPEMGLEAEYMKRLLLLANRVDLRRGVRAPLDPGP